MTVETWKYWCCEYANWELLCQGRLNKNFDDEKASGMKFEYSGAPMGSSQAK